MDSDISRVLDWAEWLGRHAVPVLAAALVLLLIAVTAFAIAIGFRRCTPYAAWDRWPRPLLSVCLARHRCARRHGVLVRRNSFLDNLTTER